MRPGPRPRRLRNTLLVARTALQHAADDPLYLAVQAARRAPARLRRVAGAALGAGAADRPRLRAALGAFLTDHGQAALDQLRRAPSPRTALGRHLAAELAVQLGDGAAVPAGLGSAPALTRARAAWQAGDICSAVDLASSAGGAGRTYAERLTSERDLVEPGFALFAPAMVRRRRRVPEGPRAFHVLTNSLPHTSSGYALRSHEVLRAQWGAGVTVAAVTRIGYPVTVGKVGARDVDVVEEVAYHRLLPGRLAGTPADRLQQMVDGMLPLVERFAPTVLHTTTNYTNALVTQAVAEAMGLPWVYEVRGQLEKTWLASRAPEIRGAAERSERYRLLHAKETEMILAADHVVALSETLAEDAVARGRAREEVTVVPNGIDAALLDQDLPPGRARAELGLPADGFWVGSVSSIVDYEGFDVLLEAVARLRAEGLDVRVALAGDGVSRPGLEARAAELGLGVHGVFPGRVARQQAPLWTQALDLFAVPRRDLAVTRAVTPLKPVTAMALGRPVVASDLPALAEVVGDPGTGVLVRPDDAEALAAAIRGLIEDPQARQDHAAAGRQFAATRTWQHAGETYRELYETLAR